jgi:nitrogen fixation/metabolism regulation signal transduction histidine kinase
MTEQEIKKNLEVFMHKFKNPLHSAVLNLDVLRLRLTNGGADKPTRQHLQIVIENVQRMGKIIESFEEYLNKSDKEKSAIDLKKYLNEGK